MPKTNKLAFYAIACAAVLAATLFIRDTAELHAQNRKSSKPPGAVPVAVAKVTRQTVAFRIQAIGNAEAYATVALKARVDGQIIAVNFKEGQKVKKGEVLFRIDPRPFEAALHQAEANLLRDTAQKEQTRSQERRYQELLQKHFVSREAYAQIRTNAETAAAVALASKAAVESARLQLGYCTIRSPLDGYIGKIMLQKGNLVKANDSTPLAVINQVQPIYVNFAVPERLLVPIREHMLKTKLPVEALVPESGKAAATGTLSFIDNSVDTSTGTIKLKAVFPNAEGILWPGQFVNVSLKLYDQKDVLVVPAQAVQVGPKGQFVYVVTPGLVAETRPVKVERTDDDRAIVASGVKEGETVVVKGQLRLTQGSKVVIAKPTTGKP